MQTCIQKPSPSPDRHRTKSGGPGTSMATSFKCRTCPGIQWMLHCDRFLLARNGPGNLCSGSAKSQAGPGFWAWSVRRAWAFYHWRNKGCRSLTGTPVVTPLNGRYLMSSVRCTDIGPDRAVGSASVSRDSWRQSGSPSVSVQLSIEMAQHRQFCRQLFVFGKLKYH